MKPLILLSEADLGVREVLDLALTDAGWSVLLTEPAAATGHLRRQRFDLAILDIGTNRRATEPIEIADGNGTRLILMTADPEIYEEIAKSGHPYLCKPFGIAELLRLIAEILEAQSG